MYMNHTANKHEEWSEEKYRSREAYKNFRYHSTSDCVNSNGSTGSGKFLTLYSKIQSEVCTDCVISQSEIKDYWTLQSFELDVQGEA